MIEDDPADYEPAVWFRLPDNDLVRRAGRGVFAQISLQRQGEPQLSMIVADDMDGELHELDVALAGLQWAVHALADVLEANTGADAAEVLSRMALLADDDAPVDYHDDEPPWTD